MGCQRRRRVCRATQGGGRAARFGAPRSRFGPRRRPGRAGHERASHGGRRGGLLNLRRPMRPSCFTTGSPAWFVALDVMTGHKRMVKLAKSHRPHSHGGTAPMTSPRRTSAATRPIAFRKALPCVRSAPRRPLRAPLYRQLEGTAMSNGTFTIKQGVELTDGDCRRLIEPVQAAVFVIQEGRFLFVNPRLWEMFGYSQQEMLDGMAPMLLCAPEYRDMVRAQASARVAGVPGKAYEIDCVPRMAHVSARRYGAPASSYRRRQRTLSHCTMSAPSRRRHATRSSVRSCFAMPKNWPASVRQSAIWSPAP